MRRRNKRKRAAVDNIPRCAKNRLHALICGGNWNNGVHCGSRAVNANNYPWNSNTNIGGRGVCDLMLN